MTRLSLLLPLIIAAPLLGCGEDDTTSLGSDALPEQHDGGTLVGDGSTPPPDAGTIRDATPPQPDAGAFDAGPPRTDAGSGSCHGLFDEASCAARADCVPATCNVGCGPSFLGCFELNEPLPVCGGAGVPCIPDPCSQIFDATTCSGTPGCHPVFNDPGTCGCAPAGCCTQFSYCATGEFADCTGANLGCLAAEPFCEGDYVVAYANQCYEGCVLKEDCAE